MKAVLGENLHRAILSFPIKYNSDEIGFYSQDPVFIQYIKAMMQGVEHL
jgi:hypothetical protein